MYKIFLLNIFLFISAFSFGQGLSLVYPNNNYTSTDSSVYFSWNIDNSTNTYNFQISVDTSFATIILDSNAINNNFCKIDTFKQNRKYFWRVRAFDGSNYSNWSITRSFIIFSPNSIPSVGLWLNADTGITFESGKVRKWDDLSSNNNDLYQYDSSLQPEWSDSLITNHACVHFTGILDYLNFTDTIDTLGGTIFTIYKNTDAVGSYLAGFSEYANGGGLYTDKDNSWFWFIGNRHSDVNYSIDTNFALISVIQDTIQYGDYWQSYYSTIKYNQKKGDSISTYGYNMAMNWLGTTNWYGGKKQCSGYLAEFIYYSTPINDSLYNLNEQYLRYKYAPPINLGYDIHIPYGFCDTTINAGSRFTNYLWSTGDTTQTITVNQSGQYSVTVTDIFGFQSSDSVMVYYPQINQQLNDTIICYGDTIKWNAGLQDTNYTFLWQDGLTSDSIYSISQAGDYYVQITDTFGCVYHSDTAHVTINNYPITTTLGNDTSLCAGQNLYLQNGASETVNYQWNTGDTTDFIQINSAGDYSVTATNTIGCIATDTVNIQIHGYAPIVGFNYNNTCFNDLTVFIDTSFTTDNSNIISWNWNFGNGDTSNIQNPNLQYLDTGNYTVNLIVGTDSNCTNTISKNIRINPLPVADFNYSNLCSNDSIYFSDNSTVSTDTITSWYWNYGNGTSATNPNNYIIYDTSSTFDISLIVTSNKGCKDTVTKSLFIKKSPVSNFTVSNTCENSNTIFINQTQEEGINQIISTLWDFGDSTASNSMNTSHLYNVWGTYNVSLTTKYVNGCQNTITKPINIFQTPNTFFVFDSVLCVNNYINFYDSSTADVAITYWLWKFDSIQSSIKQNPQIIFSDTGEYSVTLTTTTEKGCKNYKTRTVKINPVPDATFSLTSQIGVIPFTIYPTTNDTVSVSYWNFGDETTSSEIYTNHTYVDSGSYTIKLIKTNSYGCKDSSQMQIKTIIPLVDLDVFDANYKKENNSLSTSVDLINLGTMPINEIELFLEVDNGSTTKEIWTGTLNSGQIMHYDFSTIYELPKYQSVKYVCISANPVFNSYNDNNPENNEQCISLTNNFDVLNPYPNPAENNIYFQVIVPKSKEINLTIVDNIGQIIDNFNVDANAGYNKFIYNLSNLNKGNYVLNVKYDDSEKSVKFTIR